MPEDLTDSMLPGNSDQSQWRLRGDAWVSIMSSSNAISGTARYPDELREEELGSKLYKEISNSRYWNCRSIKKELSTVEGQAVFLKSDLMGAICGAEVRLDSPQVSHILERHLLGAKNEARKLTAQPHELTIEVLSIEAILFGNGEISVATKLRVPSGWDSGHIFAFLGPEVRQATTWHICKMLDELHSDLCRSVHKTIKEHVPLSSHPRDLTGQPADLNLTRAEIRSLNLVYAGCPDRPARGALPEIYRELVYPIGTRDVISQSPRLNEFVFGGYAFGVIASPNPLDRLHDLSLVMRLLHASFYNLVSISKEVREAIRLDRAIPVELVRKYYRELQSSIHEMVSPISIYRHELLVYRDAVIKEWYLERSVREAETLAQALYDDERIRHEHRQIKGERRLNVVLAILAAISVVSIFADLKSLGWFPYGETEIEMSIETR